MFLACGPQNIDQPAGADIGPEGGQFQVDGVTVIVPEGALTQTTHLTVAKVPATDGAEMAIDLGPEGVAFQKPVTVSYQAPDGTNVQEMKLSALASQGWRPLRYRESVSITIISAEVDRTCRIGLTRSRERCGNGRDDDRDGLSDCADPSCRFRDSCRDWDSCDAPRRGCEWWGCRTGEVCVRVDADDLRRRSNDCDNFCDSEWDCDDDCNDDWNDCDEDEVSICVPKGERCGNGIDDDGDCLTDCEDPACRVNAFCDGECNTNRDCLDGDICLGGICVADDDCDWDCQDRCDSSRDCNAGEVCRNGRCNDRCDVDHDHDDNCGFWDDNCRTSRDCFAGEVCRGGECVDRCDDSDACGSDRCDWDSDCARGEDCINGFCANCRNGRCDDDDFECRDDLDCWGDEACIRGSCREVACGGGGANRCRRDNDCAWGNFCDVGVCRVNRVVRR
jgi:hypothetical protein